MTIGRPSDYTPELADEICRRLVTNSMRRICMADDMPCEATVYNWLLKEPAFLEKYRVSREMQSHVMADVGSHMGLFGVGGDPQAANVQLNAIKWAASKLAPKYYGDKLDLNHGGQGEGNPQRVVISWADDEAE